MKSFIITRYQSNSEFTNYGYTIFNNTIELEFVSKFSRKPTGKVWREDKIYLRARQQREVVVPDDVASDAKIMGAAMSFINYIKSNNVNMDHYKNIFRHEF